MAFKLDNVLASSHSFSHSHSCNNHFRSKKQNSHKQPPQYMKYWLSRAQHSFIRKMSGYKVIAEGSGILKPVLDDRNYRFIRLQNDLHALVVQDKQTDKAAASLDVNVGSFADKEYNISGLAHFCEHLLFMGTEKYPKENEYAKYLSQHSGHSNAYTSKEHTNYFFEIDSEHLKGALDRFSQFFISPLFSKSCQEREILAVDSENKKNLQNDNWRFFQLVKSTSNPDHPYSGFSTGNYHTLGEEPAEKGIDVRDVLIKFWKEHYSANLMSLVIIGKEDVSTLSDWAVEMFKDVSNKNLPTPHYNVPLLKPSQQQKIIRSKPIMDEHSIELVFTIPDDQEHLWDSQPQSYYSHLLGHEGPGSVYHWAKEKGWANELSAGGYKVCNGVSSFSVELNLTTEGLPHWQEIASKVFAYLRIIEPIEWLFKEVADQSEINFKFKQKASVSQTASKLSGNLYCFWDKIPPQHILSQNVIKKYDADLIKQYGSYLNVENLRIILSSQTLKNLDQKEKWYGTEYSIEDFPPDFKQRLLSEKADPKELYLPHKNPFIPQDFTVHGTKKNTTLKHPWLVTHSSRQRVWWKQDDTFLMPRASVRINLQIPNLEDSAESSMLLNLVSDLIEDEINEISYYADLGGLHLNIKRFKSGLIIKINGFNDKLKVLLDQALSKIVSFQPKKDRFNIIKKKMIQDLNNFGYNVPYGQIGNHVLTFINDKTYTNDAKLKALEKLTYEDLLKFLAGIWDNGVFSETLAVGNLTRSDVESISNLIEKQLEAYKTIKPINNSRSHLLDQHVRYEVMIDDAENVNSCIEYLIQIGDLKDIRLKVLTDLLSTIAHEPCFNQLRTKEQLGYVVFSSTRITRSSLNYRILIQSERTTDYLEYRIESFLEKFGHDVAKLDEAEFNDYKKALKIKKLTKLKNLNEEVGRYWGHITDGFYNFTEHEKIVEVLESITLVEFQEFFKKYISLEGGNMNRLTVHLKAQNPLKQSKEKLILAAAVNYLFKCGYVIDNVEDIISAQKDQNVEAIAQKIVQTIEKDHELDSSAVTKELVSVIKHDMEKPTPETYPKGQAFTADLFKSSSKLGPAPQPVQSFEEFFLGADDAHL